MLQCHEVLFYYATFPFDPTKNIHARSHKMKEKKTHNKETKLDDKTENG